MGNARAHFLQNVSVKLVESLPFRLWERREDLRTVCTTTRAINRRWVKLEGGGNTFA